MRQTRPVRRMPGTVSSGGQPPRDQCMHPAPRLLAVRVHEPRPLGADEHTAVEAHERGSLGPAARPADGIERLFASTAGG